MKTIGVVTATVAAVAVYIAKSSSEKGSEEDKKRPKN